MIFFLRLQAILQKYRSNSSSQKWNNKIWISWITSRKFICSGLFVSLTHWEKYLVSLVNVKFFKYEIQMNYFKCKIAAVCPRSKPPTTMVMISNDKCVLKNNWEILLAEKQHRKHRNNRDIQYCIQNPNITRITE